MLAPDYRFIKHLYRTFFSGAVTKVLPIRNRVHIFLKQVTSALANRSMSAVMNRSGRAMYQCEVIQPAASCLVY